MLRIGMIGADNFHALAFSRLANLPPEEGGSGLPARVTMLWGESADRAAFVAGEARIPTVVSDPCEMLGRVDAVMVVLRHGGQHYAAALPFVQRGAAVWVDKPFTIDMAQARALVAAAQRHGALLAGGSACKYCPDVLQLQKDYRRLRRESRVLSAGLNFPGELDSPYGGLYYYGGHTAEILTTVFGPDLRSIKADVTAGNVIAVFKYADLAVCVNFAEVSRFYGTLYSPQEVVVRPIDIAGIYRPAFQAFVQGVLQGDPPEPVSSLMHPVRILNALVEAAATGREVPVPAASD